VPNPTQVADGEPLRIRFTLRPLPDYFSAIASLPPPMDEPIPIRRIGTPEHRFGQGRLWLVEPNWVMWSHLPLTRSGNYTLWLQLRHSETSAEGTDLCLHYEVELDGRHLHLEWPRLGAWHTGNAYFGWAKAKVGPLSAGRHRLKVTTSHTWCALHPRMYISRDPGFTP